ncbi:hypothetical protein EJB05_31633 [Eragrostis curvula]|uniref:Uncharacterized protein n=1 Tax=Eragrostis curvula TaxID=38414 RepID=A0A5J9UFC9_9POAL|nr:hypothetical protein EJB05_31633 [Eragrostis curvula]
MHHASAVIFVWLDDAGEWRRASCPYLRHAALEDAGLSWRNAVRCNPRICLMGDSPWLWCTKQSNKTTPLIEHGLTAALP